MIMLTLVAYKSVHAMDYNGNIVNTQAKIIFNNNSSNSYIQSVIKKTINFDGLLDQTFGGQNSIELGTNYLPNITIGTPSPYLDLSYNFLDAPYTALAIQSDGKIVMAGSNSSDEFSCQFITARFLPNGQLDSSFGQNGPTPGFVTIPLIGADNVNYGDQCYTVAIQPDQKIVLGGLTTNSDDLFCFAAVRLLPNGQLDPSFNPNSVNDAVPGTMYITPPITGSDYNICFSLVIQPNGALVMGGTGCDDSDNFYFTAARITSDGILDTTFNPMGDNSEIGAGAIYITPSIGGGRLNICQSIALQKDGSIVMGGYTEDSDNTNYFAAARLTSDGVLDTSFNPTGLYSNQPGTMYITPNIAGGSNNGCYSIALQPDGKIVMGGTSNYYFAAARLLSNGSLDPAFGGYNSEPGTMYLYPYINYGYNVCYSIVLQSDGKILMGGTFYPYDYTFGAARLLSNGQLDVTFGGQSDTISETVWVPVIKDGNEDFCYSIGLRSDGKIIMGGLTNDQTNFGLAQLINPITLSDYQASYAQVGAGMYV